MKNIVFIILVLFTLTILPLGALADEKATIPNYVTKQESNGASITVQIDDTDDTQLDPIQRKIVRRDAIISNVPTGAVSSGSATGQ